MEKEEMGGRVDRRRVKRKVKIRGAQIFLRTVNLRSIVAAGRASAKRSRSVDC